MIVYSCWNLSFCVAQWCCRCGGLVDGCLLEPPQSSFGRYAATLAATRHVVGGFAATRPGTVTYRPLRGHMPNQVSQSGQESQAGTPAGVMGEFGVWAVCCVFLCMKC